VSGEILGFVTRDHDLPLHLGRIAEISTGQTGSSLTASPAEDLPPAGPYMAGRSALRARDTLIALRDLIEEAIGVIDLYEKPKDEMRVATALLALFFATSATAQSPNANVAARDRLIAKFRTCVIGAVIEHDTAS
jgi:hypothetical protein